MADTDKLDTPLAILAHRAGLSWPAAWRKVLTGDVRAEKRGGRWYCHRDDVERLAREAQAQDVTTSAA